MTMSGRVVEVSTTVLMVVVVALWSEMDTATAVLSGAPSFFFLQGSVPRPWLGEGGMVLVSSEDATAVEVEATAGWVVVGWGGPFWDMVNSELVL